MSRLMTKGLRQSVRDYAAVAQWRDAGPEYGKGQPTDTTPFGGNVGAMAAAMLAAAGATLCDCAGRVTCETDYLAISGAAFPADVPPEMLARFNAATLGLPDEIVGEVRYKLVAAFWHPETFEARLRAAVKCERRKWENRRREEVA